MYTIPLKLSIFTTSFHFQLRLDKPERIKVKKAFGGHRKIKAYRLKKGVYFWKSIGNIISFGEKLLKYQEHLI